MIDGKTKEDKMDTQTKQEPAVIERLEKLGFKTAGAKVKELSIRQRKMAVAYEHYRFVRSEKFDKFNSKLRAKGSAWDYQQLAFTPVEQYADIPPADVLDKLEEAKAMRCGELVVFDAFEVAHIVSIKKVPDPILFGRINGCPDRFFIAQWDDDVKIEDILKPNEG